MLKVISTPEAGAWSPDSWRDKPALQLPHYADLEALAVVTRKLEQSPALVSVADTEKLKAHIAAAAKGEAFLLQAGDCAESFAEFHPDCIRDTFNTIQRMAATLNVPVVRIGRIAGQFAKPRSDSNETQKGITLPSYKGDIINEIAFTPEARTPDPARMLRAYTQSAATLDLLRGFAMETKTEFFTAHEALLLQYEQALTRFDGGWYDSSAHFLWVGNRTRQPDGAHVEFLRGIKNPIGIKVGPTMTPEGLLQLLDTLNPANEPGRMTLIIRLGANIATLLPTLLRAAKGRNAAWICDPMHENTNLSANGYKTRHFANIVTELKYFFAIMRAEGAQAAGVQLELTGRAVTECTGHGLDEKHLPARYETHCDPRLNAEQSLELASIIAKELHP